jgi:hypothetical protein
VCCGCVSSMLHYSEGIQNAELSDDSTSQVSDRPCIGIGKEKISVRK